MNIDREPWHIPQGGDTVGAALRLVFQSDVKTPNQILALIAELDRNGRRKSLAIKEKQMPRELIDTGTDKRYVRRDKDGRFSESDDVGRSHATDQKRDAEKKPKRGEGDKGDR